MKTFRLPLSLVLVGLAFASAGSARETKKMLAPESDDGASLSLSSEFRSSGSTEWKPSTPGQAKVGASEQLYTVSQSLAMRPDETLTATIKYHQMDFDFSGAMRPALPERLVEATLSALYARQLNPTWSYAALGQVGSYTAGEKGEWASGGWSAALGVIAQYRVNAALSFKLGVVYRTLAEGDERLLPVVGLAWQIGEPCCLTLGFPRTALTYQLTDRLRLGLVADGESETYRMKSEPAGVPPGGVGRGNRKLSYSEITAWLEGEYACTRHLMLRAAIGQVLQREVEYHSRGLKLEAREGAPIVTLAVEFSL